MCNDHVTRIIHNTSNNTHQQHKILQQITFIAYQQTVSKTAACSRAKRVNCEMRVQTKMAQHDLCILFAAANLSLLFQRIYKFVDAACRVYYPYGVSESIAPQMKIVL
ncbi:Hypothetical_protein [Hexamita inflata]|uniref:Hypothetical_protein n=1 Tax=Hexamita inflata TaxID=28002 RepID=A0AA86R5B0_9EUKA|nr:Hypothetical protein HINF_LOCUS58460 [Hexamita inflata]